MTQAEALDLLKLGENVFLTGAAGSGKTYVLNTYIEYLRSHGTSVAVTASTGIAATHLGGQTIHSWSGMGISDALSDDELQKIAKRERVRENFAHTKVLVIDEISMLHAHQLDLLDKIARVLLDFTKPFGGLQVILCGDFFQLPPITRGEPVQFAYESLAFLQGNFSVCYLTEQYRQTEDGDQLLGILSRIRKGLLSGDELEEVKVPLRTRYKKEPEGKTVPTKLYARNINVDAINETHLQGLNSDAKEFVMEGRGLKVLVEGLRKSCLAPERLFLKKGAEVMFVKNDPEGRYVNGTRGTIEGFDPEDSWPIVRTLAGDLVLAEPVEWRLEEDGAVRAMIVQVPLRLAWAITIHKSQGLTLDCAEIDLSDAFVPGMGYVALSRVRSLSGLKLMGLNDTALLVDERVLQADNKLRALSDALADALSRFTAQEKKQKQDEVLYRRFGGRKDVIPKHKRDAKKPARFHKKDKVSTFEKTRELLEKKYTLQKIAKERGLTVGTIISHLEKLKELGNLPEVTYLKPNARDLAAMQSALKKAEDGRLGNARDILKNTYSFDDLRLARLFL